MEAKRDEAWSLLRKWAEERVLLECELVASGCICRCRGFIKRVDAEGFEVASADSGACLLARLRPGFVFIFVDASDRFKTLAESLVIVLREDPGEEGSNDFMRLSQIVT